MVQAAEKWVLTIDNCFAFCVLPSTHDPHDAGWDVHYYL